MARMGRPVSAQENAFRQVGMTPKAQRRPQNADEVADRERQRLLDKVTGYNSNKNDLYVDGSKHNKMGKEEFLKLLTVQLENQDPMNPMEQGKMASELAQFSQLEQLSNLNKKFDGMNKNQDVKDKFYGASFLGKEVVTTGSSLKLEEGKPAEILFNLPKPAAKVALRIYDSNNAMVGEIWKDNIGRGNQNFSWDGIQLDGGIALPGEYKTQVLAWDQFSDPINVKTKNTGIVKSVFFENGETVLNVDGKKVFLRDVDSFHTPKENVFGNAQKAGLQGVSNANGNMMQKSAARNSVSNLPLEKMNQPKVNLNSAQAKSAIINNYRQQTPEPTTGITSVYDE